MNEEYNSMKIIHGKKQDVKTETTQQIRVTIHVPEHLHERIRQQKINRIYDILATQRGRSEEVSQVNKQSFFKQTALTRMERWEINPERILQFREENKVSVYNVDTCRFSSPDDKQQSIIKKLDSEYNGVVYFIIRQNTPISSGEFYKMDSFLYIDAETESLRRNDPGAYDDYRVCAYTYYCDVPEFSEFGDICIGKAFCGGIGRFF